MPLDGSGNSVALKEAVPYWVSPGMDMVLPSNIDRYRVSSKSSPYTLAVGFKEVTLTHVIYNMNEVTDLSGWTENVNLKIYPTCGCDASGIPIGSNVVGEVTIPRGKNCGIEKIDQIVIVGNVSSSGRLNMSMSMMTEADTLSTIARSISITVFGIISDIKPN